MRSHSTLILLLASIFCFCIPTFILAEEREKNILFIFDSSRSMNTLISEDVTRLDAAKQALSDLLSILPTDANVGLEVYGHKESAECDDIEIIVPVRRLDVELLREKIDSLQAFGNTPIAAALEIGAAELSLHNGEKTLLLISDGEETCNGDPVRIAEKIREKMGIELNLQVAGFDVDDTARQQLENIAQAGGGSYHNAENSTQLNENLKDIENDTATSKQVDGEISGTNLFTKEQGGHLLMAPQDDWKKTIDGTDQKAIVPEYSSAVYAFKYEKPATFNAFAVYVPGVEDTNLKDFELLVSDTSMTGPFRSIGKFQVQNAGSPDAPYQTFSFPDVTARYLKVQLDSNYGDSGLTGVYEFMIMGELDGSKE